MNKNIMKQFKNQYKLLYNFTQNNQNTQNQVNQQNNIQQEEENRDWFFTIDHKGLLYLEETEPKNFTSCIKDKRFMRNFFRNLKKNDTNRNLKYQHVSMCWGEFNYVQSSYLPIVFTHLWQSDENGSYKLLFSSDLEIDFDISKVKINEDGILHHLVDINDLEYGIFSSDLSVSFSDTLRQNDDDQFELLWENKWHKIELLQNSSYINNNQENN